ncbi:hypothetical protein [Streptacidiphilus jiangxiensis]|uniref:Uncharacterized protein n=1 Tax=Streptacidiphilus jiangxiensis TaxID=235985 RepID=A0A1H7G4I9_STRJI|nr:hypothetical protein [Streptacidiphilus jiangxiensis]SEK32984.1 hypothetical protein SAMN05414137_101533 [Streptacidiphilus jiangxiensis]
MKINWSALGSTFGMSLVITVAVVAAFCLGMTALSRRTRATGGAAVASLSAAAYVSFALCAGAVGYGFYLIAHK